MSRELHAGQQQALESCLHDAISFMALFAAIRQHPQAPLLLLGTVPLASMFVVESYGCLTTILPELNTVLDKDHAELLRASRHRAKLLGGGQRSSASIEDVAGELLQIAEEQRRISSRPHSSFLGALKRWIQPDMGLYLYDGHIFSSTHATIFGFGTGVKPESVAYSFGESIGRYIATVLGAFGLTASSPEPRMILPGRIEMRDIKYQALYCRVPIPTDRVDLAAGLSLLLASLNYVHHVLRALLPTGDHTLFRLKFLVAFHADSNLRGIQARLSRGKALQNSLHSFFRKALGNSDSRWLRGQRTLRNLLTHYLPDPRIASEFPPDLTRVGAIVHLSRGRSFEELDLLLDRHIAHLARTLEAAFRLSGDPFWLGKVS
jgi:hypothetical protein